MRRILLTLLVAFALSGAEAANVYVRSDGSDSNTGTSWSAAKLTIQKGLDACSAGDTVFVAEGTYSASVTLKDGKHIFGGYNVATGKRDYDLYPTIIDGSTFSNRLLASSAEFTNPTVIDGLILQNASHGHSGGAANLYGNMTLRHCVIRNCTTSSSGGGVYMHSGAAVIDCLIELCTATKESGAVYVSSGCTVENCIIRGCAGKYGAIYNNGGIIRNCVIHNCEANDPSWPGTAGIYNKSGQVIHCTICNNYSEGGYAGIHSTAKVYNSVFWNNQASDLTDPVNFISAGSSSAGNFADDGFDGVSFASTSLAATNNATGGPRFVNPTDFAGLPQTGQQIIAMRRADYSIAAASPMVNNAVATYAPAQDINGVSRPKGSKADVGAYEYDSEAGTVSLTAVRLAPQNLSVEVEQVDAYTVLFYPRNASDKRVQWSIDNPAIATIDADGIISALSEGQTTVRVTSVDGGFTAAAQLTVTPKPVYYYPQAVLDADEMYHIEDYTIPSFIPFLAAKEAARIDSATCSDLTVITAKLQAMNDAIANLVPKTEPYNMIANINGDPHTRMAFCWFTNGGITDGEVQLLAKADATASDFEAGTGVQTVDATPTTTKALHYGAQKSGIIPATGLPASTKFTYVSHKAIAENLQPGTAYSWRVGYDGHWSGIAQFRTQDTAQGEYSFVYMSDSHIQDQEYVDYARWCAEAVAKTVPEARFCVFPGDFVDTGTSANSEWEWERWFEESMKPVIMKMPIVPTDGNHDDSPNFNYTYHFNTDNAFNQTATVKPQFEGITYSFVYGDVLFLVYSKQDYWRGQYDYSTQTAAYLTNDVGNWFREQVALHPNTKYRVGLVHKNVFCGSGHCKDEEGPTFRTTMLPIMKECEIDLLLQGHDHTYEVIGPVNPDTRTAITSAIADREAVEVDSKVSISGYKGGTYTVDEGTLYFIGATCGRKRYSPYNRDKLDSYKSKHKMNNYFDLFTGMFAQPEAPCFTKITVKSDCLLFNSYTADSNGNATLINTMRVKRTLPHSVPSGFEDMAPVTIDGKDSKFIRNGQLFISKDGVIYDIMGRKVDKK